MLGHEIKAKFLPRDYDIFAGLDVDKKHIDVTFTDHEHLMISLKMPYDANHLLGYCRRHFSNKRVAFAYEAGVTGFGLYDHLCAEGYRCLVVSPSMVPTLPGQHVKTNRLDSKKLSTTLRGGELQSVYVPSPPYRALRQLVQLRDTFVRQVMQSQQRIKSVLLFEGLPFPEPRERWTTNAWMALQTLDCAPPIRFKLDRLISMARFAKEQVFQTTREIRRFCKEDPQLTKTLERLCTTPGMGMITATHLMARVGDGSFIHNVHQLPAFLGLVPSEDSTGNTVNKGRITHMGDRRLRAKMNQVAWVAKGQDPELGEFYTRIYHRHPKAVAAKKAITAVAAKLCRRIACMLKNQTSYVSRDASHETQKEKTAALQGIPRPFAETSALSMA